MKQRKHKIKNRKILLHKVDVPTGGRTFKAVYLTPRQLQKLNAIPMGKELFLSRFYCHFGCDIWVIRTRDGLQFMPSPFHTREWLGFDHY
jgi:hypothetical protein